MMLGVFGCLFFIMILFVYYSRREYHLRQQLRKQVESAHSYNRYLTRQLAMQHAMNFTAYPADPGVQHILRPRGPMEDY